MELNLHSLKPREKKLLDMIWKCEDEEDLARFLKKLTLRDLRIAGALVTMLEQEVAVHYWHKDNNITLEEGGAKLLEGILGGKAEEA